MKKHKFTFYPGRKVRSYDVFKKLKGSGRPVEPTSERPISMHKRLAGA